MFDYSLAHWLTFFTAAFLLNLSPGPDMAFILGQTARDGARSGFAAMFGIWSGAFLHVLFAAIGLSAIVATSAAAFAVVKWVGAGYLVWLGIQAWRTDGTEGEPKARNANASRLAIFRQGILVAALNPKVAIFFLAFLPQFVVEGAGPTSMQLFLHGALIIVVAATIEPPLVIVGGKLSNLLKGSPRVGQLMERALGSLFIALGIRLALSGRN
ncbi:LysE family translocator [Salinisphaera aquimarina]|uniref:LysE family translocator n=1 Tax=Salinisphaera aquimarina TaxID=2094031 RepID=A0ABV7EWN6_9GAMM